MEQDDLQELDWVSVPNSPYIMKYKFNDTGYNILVSNLSSLFSEKLSNTDIQDRFCTLNQYVQMKLPVILENLKKSLEKCIAGDTNHTIKSEETKLMLTLKFPTTHVLCNFEIKLDLMAAELVMHHIIRPTVFGALLCQKKILDLEKRISLNDNTKLSISSSSSISSQITVDPQWFMGQNVPNETIIEAFLKIQSQFKKLYAENYQKYSPLKNEKSRSLAAVQPVNSYKKCKLQENFNEEPTNVTFEDDEKSILEKELVPTSKETNIEVKQEMEEYSETFSSQSQKNEKKEKKKFKI